MTIHADKPFPIKRTHFVFDIETGPAPKAELETFCPKIAPHKSLKDPAKQMAFMAGKKQEWFDKAALSPMTGRVLAIGVRVEEDDTLFHVNDQGDEKGVIEEFFKVVRKHATQRWVGHNSHSFDWPFLRGRAIVNGLHFPSGIVNSTIGHRWLNFDNNVVDTMLAWNPDPTSRISLNNLAKVLGLGEKLIEEGGKHFGDLYADNPDLALKYLAQDIYLTDQIWQRIGF